MRLGEKASEKLTFFCSASRRGRLIEDLPSAQEWQSLQRSGATPVRHVLASRHCLPPNGRVPGVQRAEHVVRPCLSCQGELSRKPGSCCHPGAKPSSVALENAQGNLPNP